MKTHLLTTMRTVFGNKIVISCVVVFGTFILMYGIFSNKQAKEETVKPIHGPITQVVKVTGKVQAAKEANISFPVSGTIAFIGVKIGDVVPFGKVLATISSDDEQALVLQAKAALENSQATLAQMVQGSRPEEIAIKEQAVTSAQNTLQGVYTSLPDSIRNVDAQTSDAIKNKLASIFIYTGGRYVLSFSSCDQRLQSLVESGRSSLELSLANFQTYSNGITSLSQTDSVDTAFQEAYKAASITNDLVSNISSLLLSSCNAQNTSLDAYRASLALVRTNMNALFADISTKRTSLISAKNALEAAKRDLTLSKAGTDLIKIQAQEALVSQAQANVTSAEARLSKTFIRAPFDGVVTDVAPVSGETVTATKNVVTMISSSAFEIESSIPEIDIAKVSLGDTVDVTLDAYGTSIVFPSTITRINPAATFEGNVPKYKIIATFKNKDDRIKSGMTANIKIVTKSIPSAMILPVRFVNVSDDTKGTVTVKQNNGIVERPVSFGIRSDDGYIEITSGLTGDEEIVAVQPGVRSAQKQTQ